MKFEIVKTDIINMSTDAVVLPANTELKEGSGASAAIFKAAGRKELTNACKKLGSAEVGSAVPTPAFNLDAKYIIHAVVPKWEDGFHGEYDLLSSAYFSALNVAEIMSCESIAFPLLASGNNGYDAEIAFQIAKDSIDSFECVNLKKVYLVIYGDRMASFVAGQGYSVTEIPNNIKKEIGKQNTKGNVNKLAAAGKEIAQDFVNDQIEKAIDYLKNPKNREKIIAMGISIAGAVIKSVSKKI